MNCPACGRAMIPAQARFEGHDTTCGFRPCRCSYTAYLEHKEPGETLTEYRARVNKITCPTHGYMDQCDCESPVWSPIGWISP